MKLLLTVSAALGVIAVSEGRRAYSQATDYVPAACGPIKGMVFGGSLANDPARATALDTLCFGSSPSGGGGDFSATLRTLAAANAGHPEIAVAGVVPSGCSTAGFGPLDYARSYSSRAIAMIPLDVGTQTRILTDASESPTVEMLGVPALFFTGDQDNLSGNMFQYTYVMNARAQDAPWTYVTQPGAKHCTFDAKAYAFVWKWLKGVAGLRLPANAGTNTPQSFAPVNLSAGWLGTLTLAPNGVKCYPRNTAANCVNLSASAAAISPYSSFSGDRRKAVWLPNQDSAQAWLDLMLNGRASAELPVVSVLKPTENAVFGPESANGAFVVPVSVEASSPSGGAITSVSLYASAATDKDELIGTLTMPPFELTWTVPVSRDGDSASKLYNLYAVATDAKGNSGSSAWVPIVLDSAVAGNVGGREESSGCSFGAATAWPVPSMAAYVAIVLVLRRRRKSRNDS